MRVLITTTVWERPEVTELTYEGFDRIQNVLYDENIKSDVLVVSSEPDHTARGILRGYNVFETPNKPLGTKYNEGMKYALTLEWDYLFEMNSNNLVTDLYIRMWCAAARCNLPLFGTRHFYSLLADKKHFTRYTVRNGGLSGVGRGIRRDILESCIEETGRVLDVSKESEIDTSSRKYMEDITSIKAQAICLGEYPSVLDIKSNTDMHRHNHNKSRARLGFFVDNWPEMGSYLDM